MNRLTIPEIQQIAEQSFHHDNELPEEYWRDGAVYYRFLYHLAKAAQPNLIVELGSLHGWSTAHFAAGCPTARVIGIDHYVHGNTFPYPNLEFWTGDTVDMGPQIAALGVPVDILFIDSEHTTEQATKEFNIYWPLMESGGILLADDVNFAPMKDFWDNLPGPKWYSDKLHYFQEQDYGFGVVLHE